MTPRNWPAIAAEYIEGNGSLRAIAEKHGIPWSTLRDRARREGWAPCRRRRLAEREREACPDGAAAGTEIPFGSEGREPPERDAERIFRVTDKLVRRAEEILDSGDEVGARELGELMRAIKNAKEIKMIRSALDEREQQARLRTLEDKSGSAKRDELHIEFSPEAEEAAR